MSGFPQPPGNRGFLQPAGPRPDPWTWMGAHPLPTPGPPHVTVRVLPWSPWLRPTPIHPFD